MMDPPIEVRGAAEVRGQPIGESAPLAPVDGPEPIDLWEGGARRRVGLHAVSIGHERAVRYQGL